MKTLTFLLLLFAAFEAAAQTEGSPLTRNEKKEELREASKAASEKIENGDTSRRPAGLTFNGIPLTRTADPAGVGAEVYRDSSGNLYVRFLLRISRLQFENVTGEVLFSEQTGPGAGAGFVPFTDLTPDELEAVLAQIKYLQARKKLKQ